MPSIDSAVIEGETETSGCLTKKNLVVVSYAIF